MWHFQIGTHDLYSDSPRLRIEKIELCASTETLVVAGASGQVIVLKFSSDLSTGEKKSNPVSISDRSVAWSGPDALALKSEFKLTPGFQPVSFVQMNPPAACTALALDAEWQLLVLNTRFRFLMLLNN